MLRLFLGVLIVLALAATCGNASYIFNGGGGATTMIDDDGCVWSIGSTISTGGIVDVTLISCPFVARQVACRTGEPIGMLIAITCP